jgi:hypothetical protein
VHGEQIVVVRRVARSEERAERVSRRGAVPVGASRYALARGLGLLDEQEVWLGLLNEQEVWLGLLDEQEVWLGLLDELGAFPVLLVE